MFELSGSDTGRDAMDRIITAHKDTIQSTTKGPLFKKTTERGLSGLIGLDNQKVLLTYGCIYYVSLNILKLNCLTLYFTYLVAMKIYNVLFIADERHT